MSRGLIQKLLFLGGVLLCAVATILFAAPFATVEVGPIRASVTGFALIAQLFKDNNFKLFGVFLSFLATLGITIVLIGEFLMKSMPQVKQVGGLKPVNRLIIAFTCGLFPFILNFFVLHMTESQNSSVASIGGGAIASSILILVGIIVCCVADIAFDEQHAKDNSAYPAQTEVSNESILSKDNRQPSAVDKKEATHAYEQCKCGGNPSKPINTLKEQLLELKELMELGLITQEEFDAIKQRILGL